jgi:hypothetical protein
MKLVLPILYLSVNTHREKRNTKREERDVRGTPFPALDVGELAKTT